MTSFISMESTKEKVDELAIMLPRLVADWDDDKTDNVKLASQIAWYLTSDYKYCPLCGKRLAITFLAHNCFKSDFD